MCEDVAVAADELGVPVAARLKARLADIRAAESVADLVLDVTLTDEPPTVTLGLSGVYLILCRTNHHEQPRNADGSVAWERVSRLQVIQIGKEEAR
jgi:hypothetical protein